MEHDHAYAALHSLGIDEILDKSTEETSVGNSPIKNFKDSPRKVLVQENTNATMDLMNELSHKMLNETDLTCITETDIGDLDREKNHAVDNTAGSEELNDIDLNEGLDRLQDKHNKQDEIDGVPCPAAENVSTENIGGGTPNQLGNTTNSDQLQTDPLTKCVSKPDQTLPEVMDEHETNIVSDPVEEQHIPGTDTNIPNGSSLISESNTSIEKTETKVSEHATEEKNDNTEEMDTSVNYDSETDEGEEDTSVHDTPTKSDPSERSVSVTTTDKGGLILSIRPRRGRKRKKKRSPWTSKTRRLSARKSVDNENNGVETVSNAEEAVSNAEKLIKEKEQGTSTADLGVTTDDTKGMYLL